MENERLLPAPRTVEEFAQHLYAVPIVDFRTIPDLMLARLSASTTLGGVVAPVSDAFVVELHEEGERILRRCYQTADEYTRETACEYWHYAKRTGAVGLPIGVLQRLFLIRHRFF